MKTASFLCGIFLVSCGQDKLTNRTAGELVVSPSSLEFAEEALQQSFTVSNSGDGDLNVTKMSLRSEQAESFTVDPPLSETYMLRPDEKRVFTVTLATSPEISAYGGSIRVQSDGGDRTVQLTFDRAPICVNSELFLPEEMWRWTAPAAAGPAVLSTPLVINATDDNNNGMIDLGDIPDVLFVNFTGTRKIRLLDGATGLMHREFSPPCDVLGTAGLAAGDLTGDGTLEVVATASTGDVFNTNLCVFDLDGTLLWEVPADYGAYSAPALGDLDGDGTLEVILGRYVYNADGTLRFEGNGGVGDSLWGQSSYAVDLDGDGAQEVLAGNTAYREDGTTFWQHGPADGISVAGDCENDGLMEVFLQTMSTRDAFILAHDGTVREDLDFNFGAGLVSLAASGDLDGTPGAEFVLSYSPSPIVAFRCDGTILWQAETSDVSGASSPALFDFDGDHLADVVHADENMLRVFRGYDGTVIFEAVRESATGYESPVIADIDNDGHAEMLVTNTNYYGSTVPPGILAYSNVDDNWPAAPRIWNQMTFNPWEVDELGVAIPFNERPPQSMTRGSFSACRQPD